MPRAYDPLQYRKQFDETAKYLKNKNRILFLTTSSRWIGEVGGEQAKSTELAHRLAAELPREKVTFVDVSVLKIYVCEGNVSTKRGNSCGVKKAALKDSEKNPSGHHRCWASINNKDDELWKISKPLLESDCVVFFGSVRWGQMNSIYQKLIERLTWLENRHTVFGEENLLKNIDVGVIAVGHNWHEDEIITTQKQVLSFFGFNVVDALCWSWAFTDPHDESQDSYERAAHAFQSTFSIVGKL